MAWPTVQISDVVNRFRPLTDAETSVATTRIQDAEAELQRQLIHRGVLDAPAGDAQWVTLYVSTVADIVIRYLENRDAWTEKTFAIDDYRETLRRDRAAPPGIYVTDDELAKLLPQGARRPRGAFSIRLANV